MGWPRSNEKTARDEAIKMKGGTIKKGRKKNGKQGEGITRRQSLSRSAHGTSDLVLEIKKGRSQGDDY